MKEFAIKAASTPKLKTKYTKILVACGKNFNIRGD